ncbi:Octopamine receptor [Holothuria leucospilota]|uniref:Octopamine receptor n=1 Tax=Holothuria leucospilota TaxID=206669 RepID=A0A9Q1BAW6_HOLLE|nr:Octopamine receptor [Holothuria leucospilota]
MFLYTWVVIIYRSIVTLTGIPGNLLILFVYWNKTTLASAHVFIITLALCDLFSCLIIPLEIHYWLNEHDYTDTFLCKLLLTWIYLGWNFSACITTAIAWDRYLVVSKPIYGRWTKKKAIKVCVMCALIATLVTATVPFTSHVETDVTIAGPTIVNGTSCKPFSNGYLLVGVPQYIYFFVIVLSMISLYVKLWSKMIKRRDTTVKFALKPRCSQINEKKTKRDRRRDNKKYTSSNNEHLETEKGNRSLKRAPKEIETIKESTYTNDVALVQHSISETVKKFLPSSSSNEPVMTLNGGQITRQEYPAKFHNSKGPHDDNNRSPKFGNIMSQVPNRFRPMSRLTRMLILATVVFVCTWSLSVFFFLMDPITSKLSRQSFGFTIITVLSLTGLINQTINPVLYSFMNTKFRGECKLLFKRLRRRVSNSVCHL